jgi:hypothetical protein
MHWAGHLKKRRRATAVAFLSLGGQPASVCQALHYRAEGVYHLARGLAYCLHEGGVRGSRHC